MTQGYFKWYKKWCVHPIMCMFEAEKGTPDFSTSIASPLLYMPVSSRLLIPGPLKVYIQAKKASSHFSLLAGPSWDGSVHGLIV